MNELKIMMYDLKSKLDVLIYLQNWNIYKENMEKEYMKKISKILKTNYFYK